MERGREGGERRTAGDLRKEQERERGRRRGRGESERKMAT